MIWVLLGIFGLVLVLAICFNATICDAEDAPACPLYFIGGLGFFISFIAAIVLLGVHSNHKSYDVMIDAYLEQNVQIEQQIDAVVKNYLLHETEVYEQLKNESGIILVQLFPDLKSNELVQSQILILQENSNQIKGLKTKKAKLSSTRWWLTFKY